MIRSLSLVPAPRGPGKCKVDSLQEDDDVPLLQCSQERKRRRLNVLPSVEAVDECLSGSSVVDPLHMGCPVLTSGGGGEMPPVSSPRSSHTIAVVEGMPPVSSPQLYSGTEAMLVSDPACHTSTPAEGSEMPPVSSPTIDINATSGVMLTSDPMNNIYTGPGVTLTPGPSTIINTGPGVTLTPGPSTIINTGPGVTSTPVPTNNNFVEGSEIPPVSSPTIVINAGSGVTLTSDPMNNIYTGPGVTPTPGPSTIINTGPGVTPTPVPINNNFVEGSEIPPVSSPALVPYHDPDGHDNHNDIHLGSDTTPVSSSPIHGPSTLEPISPASPSVENTPIRPNRFAILEPCS